MLSCQSDQAAAIFIAAFPTCDKFATKIGCIHSCETEQCLQHNHLCWLPVGSQFTGTAINPARALGPAIVFHCHWNKVWLYVIAGMPDWTIQVENSRKRQNAIVCTGSLIAKSWMACMPDYIYIYAIHLHGSRNAHKNCALRTKWIPKLPCAECVGGVIAGLMAGPLYGTGATWLKKLTPWIKPTEKPSGDNNELKDHDSRASTGDVQQEVGTSPLYNSRKPAGQSTIV